MLINKMTSDAWKTRKPPGTLLPRNNIVPCSMERIADGNAK